MPAFPVPGVYAPLGWIFLALLVVNLLLFVLLVVHRERSIRSDRLRNRTRTRLAPVVERLVRGEDAEAAIGELRPVISSLRRNERYVTAWLVLDLTRDADEQTRARVRGVLAESGAVELFERSTHRRTAWRRALACEVLGAIGKERSVPVLVERLRDRSREVRMAAARALGEVGTPLAASELITLFLERTAVPTGVAYDALRALGDAGTDGFRQGLASADPTVRVASCFGLAATGAERRAADTRALLVERLDADDNGRVRTAAAKGLGIVGGAAPPRGLVDAARDGEVRVRRAAVAALGSFDHVTSVDALTGAVEDGDRETALRAAESLLALGSRLASQASARSALASSPAWSVAYARTISELAA